MLIDLPDGWMLSPVAADKDIYYVWHNHSDGTAYNQTCMVYRQDGNCHRCGEAMPDEIGGFIQLLQWER